MFCKDGAAARKEAAAGGATGVIYCPPTPLRRSPHCCGLSGRLSQMVKQAPPIRFLGETAPPPHLCFASELKHRGDTVKGGPLVLESHLLLKALYGVE